VFHRLDRSHLREIVGIQLLRVAGRSHGRGFRMRSRNATTTWLSQL
jgi:ATP-dependent Clp protease ATP-binding subunit ClpA